LPLYDLPHAELLTFSSNSTDYDNDSLFSPDISFIQLVNDKTSNSPWIAKAHEHFSNLKISTLRAYLGINKYAY